MAYRADDRPAGATLAAAMYIKLTTPPSCGCQLGICKDQRPQPVVSLLHVNCARSSRRLCLCASAVYRRVSTRTLFPDGVATESRRHLESDRWRICVQWQSLVQVTKCLQLIQFVPTLYTIEPCQCAHKVISQVSQILK